MAGGDNHEPGLGASLAVGAIAGFVATMALTSAMRRLHKQLPGKAATKPAPRAGPELRLALSFAYGAACGAALAAVNPKAGRMTGALAGGGLWLASHMGWFPSFAALPKPETATLKGDLTALGGHLAWGWSTAEAMRELRGVRTLLAEAP
jgi:hypothetical protein